MIPSIISQQTQRDIEEFLRSTFPIHTPPFTRRDRESDYRTAWAEFERRGVAHE